MSLDSINARDEVLLYVIKSSFNAMHNFLETSRMYGKKEMEIDKWLEGTKSNVTCTSCYESPGGALIHYKRAGRKDLRVLQPL